ncbi:MAG: XrtA/PEP-CTERM system TPR-repeat protein PrsT [Pseudomonadota bacterium]
MKRRVLSLSIHQLLLSLAATRRHGIAGLAAVVMLSSTGADMALAATELDKAKEELARDDPRTAIIHLRNAVRDDPDNLAARRLLGRLYLEIGKPSAAEDHLLKAHELEPEVEAAVHLADAHLQLGKFEAALRVLTKIEKDFDDHTQFAPFGLVKARTLIALNRPDEARTVLDAYLKDQPLDGEALVIRAQLDLETGALDDAARLVDRALDVDPESLLALRARVDIDRAAGRFEAAAAGLDRLAQLIPDNDDLAIARATLLLDQGEIEQGRQRLETLMAEQPDLPAAPLLLASLAASEGRFDDTRTLLQSVKPEGRQAPTYFLLDGITSAIDHQYGLAESSLFTYLEQVPDDRTARRLLANVQLNAKLDGMAIVTLEPALAADVPDLPTLGLMASAQIRTGRLEDAAATLETIINRSAPTGAENARILLALLEDERLGEERQDLARAFDHLNYGDTKGADDVASAMAETAPDNATVLNLLGVIRFRLGDDSGARDLFDRALAIDPNHEDARRGLDQVDIRAGDVAGVEARLRTRLDQQAGCEACVIELASLLEIDGRADEAYALLIDQAAVHADSVVLRQAVINKGIAAGQPVFEQPWLQEMIDIGDRGRTEAYRAAGDLSLRFGQSETAKLAFERLARLAPDDPDPHVALAQAAYQLGDVEAFKAGIESALAIDPGHRAANGMLFDMLMEADAPKAVEAMIDRLEAADPVFGTELLAAFHLRSGRPDEGIEVMKAAAAAQENAVFAHRLFSLRRQAGDVDGAIAGLRAWLIRQPGDAAAMDLLGDAFIERGALRVGLRYYEQALKLSGDNPFLLNDVAWVRQELGMANAEEVAQRAYAIAPLPEIADTLGWIMVRQGKADTGLPLLREAFQARSANPDIRYHLAYTLSETGDEEAARDLLEDLVSLDQPYAERQAALDLWDELTQ